MWYNAGMPFGMFLFPFFFMLCLGLLVCFFTWGKRKNCCGEKFPVLQESKNLEKELYLLRQEIVSLKELLKTKV